VGESALGVEALRAIAARCRVTHWVQHGAPRALAGVQEGAGARGHGGKGGGRAIWGFMKWLT
jgi:hypothetical protein